MLTFNKKISSGNVSANVAEVQRIYKNRKMSIKQKSKKMLE